LAVTADVRALDDNPAPDLELDHALLLSAEGGHIHEGDDA
jgi:hypothetical protein